MIKCAVVNVTALLVLLVSACETSSVLPVSPITDISSGVTVPYSLSSQGHYLVDVKINDEDPLQFMIDTGATVSTIYRPVLTKLGLEIIPGDSITVHGLLSSEPRPVTQLSFLRIGARSYADLRVPVLEQTDTDVPQNGIIGMDILRQSTLLFDAENQTITFVPHQNFDPEPYRTWETIRLVESPDQDFRNELLYFYASTRNIRFIALLDLGAGFSALNWDAARFPELVVVKKFVLEQQKISGAIDNFTPSFRARFENLFSGNFHWTDQEFLVLDIRAEELHGITKPGMMIAGADMFSSRTFILSSEKKLLIIQPTEQELLRRAGEQNSTRR